MNYALDHPGNIEKLILSSSILASSFSSKEEQELMSNRISEKDKEAWSKIIQSEPFKSRDPQAIKELLQLSFRSQFVNDERLDTLSLFVADDYIDRSAVFGLWGKDLSSYDLNLSLSRMNTPAHLIYDEIELWPGVSGKQLDQSISKLTLMLVKNIGHFPFIENEDQYFKGIIEFLNHT